MGQAEDRPKHHRPNAKQLANERVKLPSLRTLAQHDEALDRQREHQPRTRGVRFAATRKQAARFIKDCQRAVAIACIGGLSKNRSSAESVHRAPRLSSARGLDMRRSADPVSAKEIYQT